MMNMATVALSRRSVLRSGALAVSLPVLETFAPRRAAAAARPRRLVVWSTPNGTVTDRWACKPGPGGDTDFELSEILQPLERHRRDLVVVQNLQQNGGYGHQFATT